MSQCFSAVGLLLDVGGVLFTGYALGKLIPMLTGFNSAPPPEMKAWKFRTAVGTLVIVLGFGLQFVGVLLQ